MLKVLLFDLDGTLYVNPVIREKFAEAAAHTLAKYLHVSDARARPLISKRREQLMTEYGGVVPYTLTLRSFGVPIEYWHEENICYFDPRDYLSPDTMLQESLSALRRHFLLAVVTNNNQTQTERTLEALGVSQLFNEVFTFNRFHILKPDPAFYTNVLSVLGIEAGACCVIGDRYHIDLRPAEALGMSTIEVIGPKDIYSLPSRLCGER